MGTAQVQGELWGAAARDWADLQEKASAPLYESAFDALGVERGTTLLDAGCGAGLAATIATKRGATVIGVDASEGLLAVARERLGMTTELHHADLEAVPLADGRVDAVSAFNSTQYAGDPAAALRELARVTRSRGKVAVATWGPPERCEMRDVFAAVGALLPPPPPGAEGPFALSEPGVLEGMLQSAGLEPAATGEASCPFEYTDVAAAVRANVSSGPLIAAIRHAGEDAVNAALTEALQPYTRPDGHVRMDNVFVFAVGRKP